MRAPRSTPPTPLSPPRRQGALRRGRGRAREGRGGRAALPPAAMALPGIPYERRLLIMADPRDKALQDYRKKLLEHKEIDGRLKECERRPPGGAAALGIAAAERPREP